MGEGETQQFSNAKLCQQACMHTALLYSPRPFDRVDKHWQCRDWVTCGHLIIWLQTRLESHFLFHMWKHSSTFLHWKTMLLWLKAKSITPLPSLFYWKKSHLQRARYWFLSLCFMSSDCYCLTFDHCMFSCLWSGLLHGIVTYYILFVIWFWTFSGVQLYYRSWKRTFGKL